MNWASMEETDSIDQMIYCLSKMFSIYLVRILDCEGRTPHAGDVLAKDV
jgi:hypothetical protein